MKTKFLVLTAAAVIAFSLKHHYADSRADDLWWILTPTAWLVGATTDATFVMQPGEGYFSRERLFLIEKSCAGINFMISAFAMLVCAFFHRARSATSALHVVFMSLVASYSTAVFVNALRIIVAMWLAAHPETLSTFSTANVHRVEGITIYFAGLVLLYEVARALDRRIVVFPCSLGVDARRFKGVS